MPVARGVKAGIIGAVFIGMVGVAGYGAYNIYSGLDGKSTGTKPAATADRDEPLTAKDVNNTATDFLAAWSAGDDTKAAALTDSVETAKAALADYRQKTSVSKVAATLDPSDGATGSTATAGPTGAIVSFTVKATISYQGIAPKIWSYVSTLTVGRNTVGDPAVKWAPAVLEPDLKDGLSLVTGLATSPDLDLVDRHGKTMTAAQYPGLTDVFTDLRKRYADADLGGTPGIETYVTNAGGELLKTLYVVKPGKNAKLKTTLDAGIQAAAEKAVQKHAQSGVTALDTHDGTVLAMAANPPGGTNYALSLQPPGSTFKIVTATALMTAPVTKDTPRLTPGSVSQCVDGYAALGGKPYHNVTPDKQNATLAWDFSRSCNTGFIRLSKYLAPDSLTKVGEKYFGLVGDSRPWYTGTGTTDGSIPGGTGDELTSEMIGQGRVLMNTLNMASVAATVRGGRFHQPSILDDTKLIENRQTWNATPLPPQVRQNLMSMMRQTADSGTAAGLLNGVNCPCGAKTGSAEESSDGVPTGWFTAYSDDVAAAAMVMQGDHGNKSAGPIVGDVLRAAP
ncbi:penicillin-binding transpeptidase domain-containing protein [Streptomyces cocklensis]|uniref:NTF2-like N-terminal transpeptidase domain-containing protein n=1 Tax=Actinacidiphila cocklensis TaxID=887465 RepID=A0A9W4E4N9_9ACTN|nr:penicillin-binding transpeptidase domain-containing protein [Actinacidiphila cocklensis]MDD1057363.1 penicillin-binding transpeptidase domain-containing protein [Actinacidiphila cocklensis]CAG6399352.1 NTF2-like N-terminal transpeptidase domain-containing protein [Actinacidiphila cocklensis]